MVRFMTISPFSAVKTNALPFPRLHDPSTCSQATMRASLPPLSVTDEGGKDVYLFHLVPLLAGVPNGTVPVVPSQQLHYPTVTPLAANTVFSYQPAGTLKEI